VAFARELAEAKPAVVWHPGWMTSRYMDSFYFCRSIYLINALLGSVGAKGGMPLTNTPSDVGRKGLKKFVDLYPNHRKSGRTERAGVTLTLILARAPPPRIQGH